jgi:hypothetical protein
MTKVLQGQMVALFAFDIGYRISLDRVASLLASTRLQPLSQKKRTPPYHQYARPPHRVNLEPAGGILDSDGSVQLTLYDFGAVSISYSFPMSREGKDLRLDETPELAQRLYSRNLEADARNRIRTLLPKIQPAIDRPLMSDVVEDYYLFILEKLSEPLTSEELLRDYPAVLAQVLRLESLPLSADQQLEATDNRMSYYPDDLVIVDWNAAVDPAENNSVLNCHYGQTKFVVNAGEQLVLTFNGEFSVGAHPFLQAFISGVIVPAP